MSKKVNIKSNGHLPFEVSFRLFVSNSEKFANEEPQTEIDFGDEYEYDSLVQFFSAIENKIPNIVKQNAFEYSLLCDIWEVTPEIKKYVDDFFDQNDEDFLIPHIIFLLKHNSDANKLMEQLKNELPEYINDPNLKELDYDILLQIINFKNIQNNDENFQKVFSFCLNYLDEHRNEKNCSELFSTLDLSKLSIEDQRELEIRPYFDRSILKDSLGKALTNIDLGLNEIIEYIRDKKAQERVDEIPVIPPLFYPNWTGAENKGWINIAAPNCCWLFAYSANNNQNNPSAIIINNKMQFNISGCNSNYGGSTISIPINLGQQISFLPNSYTENQAFIVPFKNNNEIVCLPNYAESRPKVWNQRNVAECNGWIYACSGSCSGRATITINDSKSINFSYHNGNYNSFGSIFLPISRGDSYKVVSASSPNSLLFIPGKDHTQTGFPDYEKISNLGWGEIYTANEPGWIYAHSISYNCASDNPQCSPAYLTVNGTLFLVSQINAGHYMMSSIFIPISKGDKYGACGGNSTTLISFLPFVNDE